MCRNIKTLFNFEPAVTDEEIRAASLQVGMKLHEWVFPLKAWREMHGMEGGEVNESSKVVEESMANIGATIMGRNMFGGHPGPWDAKKPWSGWWGDNPPFHHPVFVLTHHA